MKLKKTCKNCIHAKRISVNSDMLCMYKGVVSADYVCKHHKYISDSSPVYYKKYRCIDCRNFAVKSDGRGTQSSNGQCRLFSVRYFDGRNKNACSKFEHRQEKGVS